jgi:glycosyltransferase involved in cell wall biosynthesis
MICGLPVVAADAGSTSRVVLDGETGFVVPVGDESALTGALIQLIEDPELRGRMGKAGERFAREHFIGYSERMEMEFDIFNKLLGKVGR